MYSKKSKVSNDFMKNDNYNQLKDQLETQNQALLQQRKAIQSHFGIKPKSKPNTKTKSKLKRKKSDQYEYSINEQRSLKGDQDSYYRSTYTKTEGETTNRIKKKIHDVINMCENDQRPGTNDFRDIVEAQKQILNYLEDHETPRKERRSAEQLTRSKMRKIASSHKKSIREEISNNGFKHLISDDAMELIEEIERKTLLQIESLRMDKIMLMKKLNQEIEAHNEEKHKRIILENKVRQLEQLLEHSGKRIRATTYPLQKQKPKYYQHQEIIEQPEDSDEESEEQEQDEQYEQNSEDFEEEQSPYRPPPVKASYKRQNQPQQRPLPQVISQNTHPYRQTRQPHVQERRNGPRSQPLYQVPQMPPSHFREAESTGGFGAENQMHDQIHRLQHENRMMKENLSNSSQVIYNPLKNQLKSQLSAIQNQIKQYETVLKNNQSTVGSEGLDSLLMNGNSILNDGQKLMRVRSKPEFRNSQQQQLQEIRYLKSRINDLQEQNRGLQKDGKKDGYSSRFESANRLPSVYTPNRNNFGSTSYLKSQTPKARNYSSNNYESVIEEMRRAAG